jgi:isopentenyl-diphosphate Delta-isomerase
MVNSDRNILILVDETDTQIGTCEKIKAHQEARLHRAFSVLVYNQQGQMLLQKRAVGKYHAGGLWTNACCGHPLVGEEVEAAAHRRLQEEMGFDCVLKKDTSFIYKVPAGNGLTEHEFLHVFSGTYKGPIVLNPEEASDYRWVSIQALQEEIKKQPEQFTPWFPITLQNLKLL